MIMRYMPILVPLVLACTLLSAVSCGGGRSPGNVVTTTCISFQAGAAPGASTAVARQAAGSNCDLVVVELALTGIDDVLALEFQAGFDGSLARYTGYTLSDSLLTSDGEQVEVFEDSQAGMIRIVMTRLADSGIDFAGTGAAIRLYFPKASASAAGSGALSFSGTRVLGSEAPPQEKAGIQWIGGTIHVD
jgi:hypothetical protein